MKPDEHEDVKVLPATPDDAAEIAHGDGLPPVVARMVIEIRSDGTKTIARGALEDRVSGQTVAIEADAATPWALSRKLAGSLLSLPSFAKSAVRSLMPFRRDRDRKRR